MRTGIIRFFFRKSLSIALGLALLYVLVSVGYYSLPETVRALVRKQMPDFDKMMVRNGYRILQNWDDLALVGCDAEVKMDRSYGEESLYAGRPEQTGDHSEPLKILANEGFIVGYSDERCNPLWVAYRIFDVPTLESDKRPGSFSTDRRTQARVSDDDYNKTGYDRGHMAPNYGIATRYGRDAQLQTFQMSNVIPQTPSINRYLWKDLEMRVAEKYGRFFSEVWVITGPVFEGEIETLASGISIPTAYYKIMVDEREGKLRALAFLVPSDYRDFGRIKKCLVSIDEVEELTQLDFFPELPEEMEKELESEKPSRLWPWIGSSFAYRRSGKTD
ncbi:MAG: DNA/RNA non-specific endonuclease [Pontiellaceae bacterium]|nr:DNA/RNA non-specific endonuclease [Pontiellaceae bacterium]